MTITSMQVIAGTVMDDEEFAHGTSPFELETTCLRDFSSATTYNLVVARVVPIGAVAAEGEDESTSELAGALGEDDLLQL